MNRLIKEIRLMAQMNQEQFANALGTTPLSINRWENGKTMPDVSLFEPICKELNITINEFLSGEKIDKKDYQDKFEENVINTISYANKKLDTSRYQIGIFLLVVGFLVILTVNPKKALIFIIIILILQQVEQFTTYPIIVGKYVGLSSFLTLLSVVVGGGLFGFWGLILGVPIVAFLDNFIKVYIDAKQNSEIDIKDSA